jgi:hypothetical protein
MGTPKSLRVLYKNALHTKSQAYRRLSTPDILSHSTPKLTDAEFLISSPSLATKSTLMVPNNVTYIWI